MKHTNCYTLGFHEIDGTKSDLVGGKGANLGVLSKIEGIHIPEGFCITTEPFQEAVQNCKAIGSLLDQLARQNLDNGQAMRETTAKIRKAIEELTIPNSVEEEITRRLKQLGESDAYAIRSSATAEDLPTASFAGQQDTYLNITGKASILKHIRKCWASLFTDRAVTYRPQHGFDHHSVSLSVVVQKMVFPQVAGILFTADPVTANRKVVSIDASFGLGEALVSGLVNPDVYKVQKGTVMSKKIAVKKVAVHAVKTGGTKEQQIGLDQQSAQALTNEQILRLESIGRKIEKHFGSPQDVEWCLMDNTFYIVQSRPITTLYPIPQATVNGNRVYVSVGHQQMMTDAMKPLGLSLFQLTAARPMYEAAGRLFVDITQELSSPATREMIVNGFGKSDPLIKDALNTLLKREDFIRSSPDEQHDPNRPQTNKSMLLANLQTQVEYDPDTVPHLVKHSQASIEALQLNIQKKSGPDLFDFILEDIQQLKKFLHDPKSLGVIMTAMNASAWINERMHEWLGEKNAADTLSQSVPDNVTSEMGLALLDVADAIRPYPEVIDYLRQVKDGNFFDELMKLHGGSEARVAIEKYLDKYGMRCAGEIDITKTRWREKPHTLLPLILSNIKNFEPGAGKRKFEQGRQEVLKKEQELLERLKGLPDGEQKAKEAKRMINLIRNFAGYREYPKYDIVSRYFVYKQALLKEADRLVEDRVLSKKEDAYFLTFKEFQEVTRTRKLDYRIITKRKDAYKSYEKLTPPRVITSDGEIITGTYNRDNLPAEALAGLPVSSGIVEGRARVILTMDDAILEEDDILITTFTDPSWTPLFVSIKGLVTEVGGLMTHGAVIAREYGLPAVVGVENATKVIKDGQRVRVNGTDGYVELLSGIHS